MQAHTIEVEVGGQQVTLETGKIARQAAGAVVVRHGDSMLLGTAVAADEPRSGVDFFPLTVDYREKLAAGGLIPGSFLRREGRITEREILTSRLIDRTLRPLFAAGFVCETQVLVTVYSADPTSDLDTLALLAAAAAVHASGLPFDGPVAGLRVARSGGALHGMPAPELRAGSELDLVVSASRGGLVMVEGEASRVPDAQLLDALDGAVAMIAPVLDALDRLRELCGRATDSSAQSAGGQRSEVELPASVAVDLDAALDIAEKQARRAAIGECRTRALSGAGEGDEGRREAAESAFEALLHHRMRSRLLEGRRIGGRRTDEVREISGELGTLPSNHGSALFTRGETQALVSATIGGERDSQDFETLAGRISERFLLHYNFPPFSVGETRPMRGPGRREIGHGNLARRALAAVLPAPSEFPYTLRIVSDITESNGSSSMATVCGGCLALIDAGVPIAAPVAGIAMGLVVEGDEVVILSDILGDEDHLGDMDFKVAGTAEGVTAVQLDNKVGSLPRDVLARALAQAGEGRRHILARMEAIVTEAREAGKLAPSRFLTMTIDRGKIGALIGPGGQTIKEMQRETNARIDVRDDGTVTILGEDGAGAAAARKRVEALCEDLREGGVYVARVVKIMEYGAFVRVGDHEGLVHISELKDERVESVRDVVDEGDEILIRVLGVDDRGRLKLSTRAAAGVERSDAING